MWKLMLQIKKHTQWQHPSGSRNFPLQLTCFTAHHVLPLCLGTALQIKDSTRGFAFTSINKPLEWNNGKGWSHRDQVRALRQADSSLSVNGQKAYLTNTTLSTQVALINKDFWLRSLFYEQGQASVDEELGCSTKEGHCKQEHD